LKTHTIKKIKSNCKVTHCIVTFTKQYLELLKNSHPDSVALITQRLCVILKELTNNTHMINDLQWKELEEHFGDLHKYIILGKGYLKNRIKNHFINGFNCQSLIDLEEDLEILNYFFKNFDKLE